MAGHAVDRSLDAESVAYEQRMDELCGAERCLA
jgi:hypothetical protein